MYQIKKALWVLAIVASTLIALFFAGGAAYGITSSKIDGGAIFAFIILLAIACGAGYCAYKSFCRYRKIIIPKTENIYVGSVPLSNEVDSRPQVVIQNTIVNKNSIESGGCCGTIIGAMIIVIVAVFFINACTKRQDSIAESSVHGQSFNAPAKTEKTVDGNNNYERHFMTREDYNKITIGMTATDFNAILKTLHGYEIIAEGEGVQMFQFTGDGNIGANANITLQNGKVVNKAQFGL